VGTTPESCIAKAGNRAAVRCATVLAKNVVPSAFSSCMAWWTLYSANAN
jgi:hypothetical protein